MRKPHGLNFLLETINTALLVEEAPWETVELVLSEINTTDARVALSVSTKAILVDALQKRGLRYSTHAEEAMERLLVSCHGEELTKLKNMTDLGGDYLNLYKLIYSDITSHLIREKVLKHFSVEAKKMTTERGGSYGLKILSDVDDTLYSSGGKFPAGMDKEYPKHQLYPGCLEFFKALDKQGQDDDSACNLVFLSARPHAYKDMAEEHSYRLFKKLVREEKMHTIPTPISEPSNTPTYPLPHHPSFPPKFADKEHDEACHPWPSCHGRQRLLLHAPSSGLLRPPPRGVQH